MQGSIMGPTKELFAANKLWAQRPAVYNPGTFHMQSTILLMQSIMNDFSL
jgi:hypothetical protein